jgi:hypothetical protein
MMHGLQSARRLGCSYIFQRDGKKICEFRKTWEAALTESGMGQPTNPEIAAIWWK